MICPPQVGSCPIPHEGGGDERKKYVALRAVIFIHSNFIHTWKDPLPTPLEGTDGGPRRESLQKCIKLECIKITALTLFLLDVFLNTLINELQAERPNLVTPSTVIHPLKNGLEKKADEIADENEHGYPQGSGKEEC